MRKSCASIQNAEQIKGNLNESDFSLIEQIRQFNLQPLFELSLTRTFLGSMLLVIEGDFFFVSNVYKHEWGRLASSLKAKLSISLPIRVDAFRVPRISCFTCM